MMVIGYYNHPEMHGYSTMHHTVHFSAATDRSIYVTHITLVTTLCLVVTDTCLDAGR
jgi:hypothetical protein